MIDGAILGQIWAYIVFNIGATLFLYWAARVSKKKFNWKSLQELKLLR